MNIGTRVRTVLAVATCLNTALMATDVAQFGNETINLLYRIISVALNFVIVACVTWYNNDYTEEATIGTGLTRQLKAEQTEGYIGENFFDDEDDADIEEGEDDESDNMETSEQ